MKSRLIFSLKNPPQHNWKIKRLISIIFSRSWRTDTNFSQKGNWSHYFRRQIIVESLTMPVAWCRSMKPSCAHFKYVFKKVLTYLRLFLIFFLDSEAKWKEGEIPVSRLKCSAARYTEGPGSSDEKEIDCVNNTPILSLHLLRFQTHYPLATLRSADEHST